MAKATKVKHSTSAPLQVVPASRRPVLLNVPGRMLVTRIDAPTGCMFLYTWAGDAGVSEATGEYQAGLRPIPADAEYVGSYEDDRLCTGGIEWTDSYWVDAAV